jgi:hypothetical protein
MTFKQGLTVVLLSVILALGGAWLMFTKMQESGARGHGLGVAGTDDDDTPIITSVRLKVEQNQLVAGIG